MKICFIGSGSIGKRHIRNINEIMNIKQEKISIHLLRSSHNEIDYGILFNIKKQVWNIDELDDSYDAIFICNPTYLHYDTLKQVVNLSNNFFVEKPVFDKEHINADISYFLKEKIYYVACPLRYSSVFSKAKDLLREEKVLSVRAISSSYLPEWRNNVDYRMTYSAHDLEGGGVRLDLIHEWDYLVDLFGFPEEIRSYSGKISSLEIDSEDIAIYIARYKNIMLELHLDYYSRNAQRYFEVTTTENQYRFDLLKQCIFCNKEEIFSIKEDNNLMYIRELENYLNIIQRKAENNNSLENAIAVTRLTLT